LKFVSELKDLIACLETYSDHGISILKSGSHGSANGTLRWGYIGEGLKERKKENKKECQEREMIENKGP